MIKINGHTKLIGNVALLSGDIESLILGADSYFKMDELSGTTLFDSSENNVNGTILEGGFGIGKINGCYETLTNEKNVVTFGNNFDASTTRTYNIWVNKTTFPYNLIGKGPGSKYWRLSMEDGQNLQFLGWEGGFTNRLLLKSDTGQSFPTGWVMVTLTTTGGNTSSDFKVYFNGVYKPWTDILQDNLLVGIANSGDFYLQPATVSYTAGKLDEFGIWNRILTDAEILTLYNNDEGLQYPFIQW